MLPLVIYLSGDKAYAHKLFHDLCPGDLVDRDDRAEPVALITSSPKQSECPDADGLGAETGSDPQYPVMLPEGDIDLGEDHFPSPAIARTLLIGPGRGPRPTIASRAW